MRAESTGATREENKGCRNLETKLDEFSQKVLSLLILKFTTRRSTQRLIFLIPITALGFNNGL